MKTSSFLPILCITALPCSALAGVIDADVYLDFEHGASGNIVTAADVMLKGRYTNRVTSVTLPNLTTLAISATGERALPHNVTSGNVIYGDSGTRGWAWTNTANQQYVQLNFNAAYDNISCGFWFRMTAPRDAGGGNYSYTGFKGQGGYAVHAFVDSPTSPKWVIETINNDGTPIPAVNTNWVWVTMVYHRNANSILSIYDASGVLIGSSTNSSGNHQMTMLQIGREDAHAHPADIGFAAWTDDVIIDFDGAFPLGPFAVTNTPASLAVADVQAAVNATPNGGTVQLPAGAATWTTRLTITNGISLFGSGTNAGSGTFITNGIAGGVVNSLPGSYLFYILPASANQHHRISSIFFDGNGNNLIGLEGNGNGIPDYRIDHCYFYNSASGGGLYNIWAHYAAYGVIDHCSFYNCDKIMRVHRDLRSAGEWAKFPQSLMMLGSTNTSVVEDCVQYMGVANQMAVSGGQALHYTFRHNSIHAASTSCEGVEAHGNSSCDPNDRGSLGGEIYNNTFDMSGSTLRAIRLRGGMWMVYSNTIIHSSGAQIQLTEEEGYAGNIATACGFIRTEWPAIDQITNSFFWQNTINGGAGSVSRQFTSDQTTFILEDRDYWLRAPQREDVVGAKKPLAYPHPRVRAEDGGAPPSGTAPSLSAQPQSQTVLEGATATFAASASGTAPLNYQWKWYSTNVVGATSSAWTTAPLTTNQNDSLIQVAISNAWGSVISDTARLTVQSVASASASILPEGREAIGLWANTGVSSGIPVRTTIYTNVVNAGATPNDLTDDSSIIQACLNGCPSNQVVYIPAGRYVLGRTLTVGRNGVTLRGAGPGYGAESSILAWTNTGSINAGVLVTHSGAAMSDTGRAWTGGFTRGTTNITITPGADYPAVGDVICMDQVTCLPGYIDGDAYHSRANGTRTMQQFAKVYAVNSTAIALDRPLVTDFTNTRTTEVVWFTPTKRVSVEQITLDTQGLSSGNRYPLAFNYSDQCWATNIECRYGGYANVYFDRVIDCELTHSYMHELQQYAQRSAGIDIREAHGCKVENNIFVTLTTPIYVGGPGSHNVYAYNYMTNCVFTPSASWMTPAIGLHSSHNWFLLFEGNIGWQIDCDNLHGSASHCTFLRNRMSGYQANKTSFAFPFSAETTNWFMNVVGNVLGTSGFHNMYRADGASYGSSIPIYRLGFNAANSTWNSTCDPAVGSTIIIHGNYDTVTRTNSGVVWSPAVTNHVLPDSYYLPSKPAWFGDRPWPPFSPFSETAPDREQENIPAGYRYLYHDEVPSDSLQPPSNLRVFASGGDN
jgi:hypothetical protein